VRKKSQKKKTACRSFLGGRSRTNSGKLNNTSLIQRKISWRFLSGYCERLGGQKKEEKTRKPRLENKLTPSNCDGGKERPLFSCRKRAHLKKEREPLGEEILAKRG